MYIFKNALRSIARAKGRNVLIGIIVLVISISACIALSIRESAAKAKEDTLSTMTVTAQISFDRQSVMSSMREEGGFDRDSMKEMLQGTESLTLADYEKYAAADSVKATYYTLSSSLSANEDIEPVDTMGTFEREEQNTQQGNPPSMPNQQGGGKGFMGKMGSQGDFTVIGYSSDEAMTDFKNGNTEITSGAVFSEGTAQNECIISEELATYNDLTVGSEITLINPNDEEETVTLKVVGIYKNNSEEQSAVMGGFSTAGDSANRIYMSYTALEKIVSESKSGAEEVTDEKTGLTSSTAIGSEINYTYVLESADAYEAFSEEVKALGLDEKYTVSSSDLTAFEQSMTPLNNLSEMATYFLMVVFAIGACILIAINIFNIRERKYEIGVLTSIGMKKGKVAMQFIIELFCVTLVAIIIGAGVGAAASVPVTNTLLASQIESNRQVNEDMKQNFGRDPGAQGGGMTEMPGGNMGEPPSDAGNRGGFKGMMQSTKNYISQVSYSTNLNVILQLMVVGILLTVISSLAAVVLIMRYEPLKILTNRD